VPSRLLVLKMRERAPEEYDDIVVGANLLTGSSLNLLARRKY